MHCTALKAHFVFAGQARKSLSWLVAVYQAATKIDNLAINNDGILLNVACPANQTLPCELRN